MSQVEIVGTDILLEFLEVAFHDILFVRRLYPKEIFVRKKVFGTAVHISEHPELNEYIKKVLNAIGEMLKEDGSSIKAIILSFYNKDRIPIEKFVFDLLKLQDNKAKNDPYFLKTEEALRTICLKLSMTESYLKPLPEESTFSIEVRTHEAAHVALNENPRCEDFPWIEAEGPVDLQRSNLLPLKTIDTEYVSLQAYVLEDEKMKDVH